MKRPLTVGTGTKRAGERKSKKEKNRKKRPVKDKKKKRGNGRGGEAQKRPKDYRTPKLPQRRLGEEPKKKKGFKGRATKKGGVLPSDPTCPKKKN